MEDKKPNLSNSTSVNTPNSGVNSESFGASQVPVTATPAEQKISTDFIASQNITPVPAKLPVFVDDSSLENLSPTDAMLTGSLLEQPKQPTDSSKRRRNRLTFVIAGMTLVVAVLIALLGTYFANRSRHGATNLSAQVGEQSANIDSLKVDTAIFSPTGEQQRLVVNGNADFTGNITAANFKGTFKGVFNGSFTGDGSGIQNIKASNCDNCVLLQPNTPGVSQVGGIRLSGTGAFGAVGVGTATPGFSLDVVGDINASHSLLVGGIPVCDTTGCISNSNSNSQRYRPYGQLDARHYRDCL
jgi:hypothetical protein